MRRGREYEFAAAETFVTRGDGQLLLRVLIAIAARLQLLRH